MQIEINEHIYEWKHGSVFVTPYSKYLDIYTEREFVCSCPLEEAERRIKLDAQFRQDPIKRKEKRK